MSSLRSWSCGQAVAAKEPNLAALCSEDDLSPPKLLWANVLVTVTITNIFPENFFPYQMCSRMCFVASWLKMTMGGPQGVWTYPAQLVVSYFLGLILHLYSYALLQWVLGNSLNASSISLSCIGEEMATHSSVLAWRIPGTGEPGGLPPMGSHRVGHD